MPRLDRLASLTLALALAATLTGCGADFDAAAFGPAFGNGAGEKPGATPGAKGGGGSGKGLVKPQAMPNVINRGDRFVRETDSASAERLARQIWGVLVSRSAWVSTVSSNRYSFYACSPAGGSGTAPCFTYDGWSQYNGSVRTYAVGHYYAADGSGPYLTAAVGLENDEGMRLLGIADKNHIAISNTSPGGGAFIVTYRAY